jgi:solute carrier family 25 S-adenosylmethionine transporter 26
MQFYVSQEYLKLAWLRDSEETTLEPWQSVMSGAAAGALSASITTPLDVVKTRLMTQDRKSVTSAGLSGVRAEAAARAQAIAAYTYTGFASTLNQIWIEEGALGLTKGMGPRLFYSACFSALGFFAFETARVVILRKYLEDRAATDNVDGRVL